ncbi:MAG TPA: DUF4184 family protein [Verrucomicrobiae bacterium]|nr:DUF4184 family protein [Verrucomicrobiae bacterium]
MPFPLAHPAAILPLRRFCPRFLSFPALVAGSISPDTGYLFGGLGVDVYSHKLVPGTFFGVISGLVLLAVYWWAGPRVLPLLARPSREMLRPLLVIKMPPTFPLLLSLAIGVWSHLLLDSFTHSQGWLVRHSALLQTPVFMIYNHAIRVCHLLWYGFSFAGIAWLILATRQWLEDQRTGNEVVKKKWHLWEALLGAALILPIEIIHHLARSRAALVVVAALSLGCVVVVAGRMVRARQAG